MEMERVSNGPEAVRLRDLYRGDLFFFLDCSDENLHMKCENSAIVELSGARCGDIYRDFDDGAQCIRAYFKLKEVQNDN